MRLIDDTSGVAFARWDRRTWYPRKLTNIQGAVGSTLINNPLARYTKTSNEGKGNKLVDLSVIDFIRTQITWNIDTNYMYRDTFRATHALFSLSAYIKQFEAGN